jgi:hypothetical protein
LDGWNESKRKKKREERGIKSLDTVVIKKSQIKFHG